MFLQRLMRGVNKSRLAAANRLSMMRRVVITALIVVLSVNLVWVMMCTTARQRQDAYHEVISLLVQRCQLMGQSLRSLVRVPRHDAPAHSWRSPAHDQHHPLPTWQHALPSWQARRHDAPWPRHPALSALARPLQQGAWMSVGLLLLLCAVWVMRMLHCGKQRNLAPFSSASSQTPCLPVKRLNRQLRRARQCSPLTIGNGYYVKHSEVEHLLCVGGSGNGKTTFFLHGMANTKAFGHRQVIFDLDGAFLQHFYRPGKDIILSLRDQRSPCWNFYSECNSVFDVEKRAKSMVPTGNKGSEQWFWNYLAQIIFSAVASQLFLQGKTTTKELLSYLYAVDREDIATLLAGTLAESYVAKGMEKMTGSIKGVLSVYINSLRYLKEDAADPSDFFSITRWMQDDKQSDSTLFISVQEDDFELFRPVIAFWLDTAVAAALALPASHQRRIWFRYDEVSTLGHLPSLLSGLTKGRKKGLCFVLGAQSLAQFRDNYSAAQTDILFDNCHTKLYFAIEGADTAKWVAADIGEQAREEAQDSVSVATGSGHQQLSSSQHVRTAPIISYTDIKRLPKFTALLSLPGDYPVTQVRFTPFKQTPTHEAVIARPVQPMPLQVLGAINGNNTNNNHDKIPSQTPWPANTITLDQLPQLINAHANNNVTTEVSATPAESLKLVDNIDHHDKAANSSSTNELLTDDDEDFF